MNPSLLIAIPLLTAFIIPLVAKLHKKLPAIVVLISTLISFLITISLFNTVMKEPLVIKIGNWNIPFGINLYIDKLALISLIIISGLTFIISIYNFRDPDDLNQSKFNSMFLLAFTGINGIVLTGDIFNLFVFIEIAAIATYVLATMKRKNSYQAAFKYIVMGSIASVFLLMAIGFTYSSIGSLNMAVIARSATQLNPSLLRVITLLLLVGVGIEAELFPMNLWIPEVYSKSYVGVTALLSGVLSVAGIYAMLRIYFTIFGNSGIYFYLTVIGAITLILGEFIAFQQKNIKKMLAYSSIAQMGLVITVISLNSVGTMQAGLFQLLNHSILKVLLFISAGLMSYAVGSSKIKNMAGLGKKMPIAGLGFTIGALGIMGLPFLNGFVSKMMILQNTLGLERYIITGLILLATLIEVAYYLKVVQTLYFKENTLRIKQLIPCIIPVGILSLSAFYLGIFPQHVINILNQVGSQLLDNSNYIISILGGI